MKLKHLIFTLFSFLIVSCKGQKVKHRFTNQLVNETSPYLLQHAHNPVDWHAWNKETLAKAKKENKLLLISIGYAACHWCHVMEHESFENEEVARIMNANFINIKVDREERPDVDKVYMTSVQLITGRGGWPLNAIALPDGRPVWAGTYYPKNEWQNILTKLSTLYKEEPKSLLDFAEKLHKGIKQSSLVKDNPKPKVLSNDNLKHLVGQWTKRFDQVHGGANRSPKFPMPSNYEFLLRYAHQQKDANLMEYVNKTLTKMAYGGINDQVGGGFARYSTDKRWHIPHFEKMLYDNAQLVSLYANAYKATKNDLYKTTLERTIEFLERELLDSSGAFYSSLDADSKDEHGHLEEGAFYVWTKEELKKHIKDFDLLKAYYNVNTIGKWEKSNYNFIRTLSKLEFSKKYKISVTDLDKKVKLWNSILLKKRSKRSRPRLDDKILTAWNGLMLKGYCDAYKATENKSYLKSAKKLANFILRKMTRSDNGLFRNYKNGKANINAYLQDYATVIDGYLALYEVTFDEQWLVESKKLTEYCMLHFYDKSSGFFFFTSNEDPALISKDIETTDGVIPSSNAMMAKNLFLLGQYYDVKKYKAISSKMIEKHSNQMYSYPSSKSEWLQLHLDYTKDFYEVSITGNDCLVKNRELSRSYIPNKLVVGAVKKSTLGLLKKRFTKGKTTIYVCKERVCLLPTEDVNKAIKQLKGED